MWHFQGVAFRRHFSYSKAAQYLMHSTEGCATARRVLIIQAKAFSAVRVATSSSQITLGRTCFLIVSIVYDTLRDDRESDNVLHGDN